MALVPWKGVELSVLFGCVIQVKPARHRSVDGVFHCSLLTCRAAEDIGALNRRFLHLSSLREGKSICQGGLLSERIAFVKLASLGTVLVQTQPLFLVEKRCCPMLRASWIPCRSLLLSGRSLQVHHVGNFILHFSSLSSAVVAGCSWCPGGS